MPGPPAAPEIRPRREAEPGSPDLEKGRKVGLFDATMLVMGGIVGAGIFINPYVVAREVPRPGWILGAWAVGGLADASGPTGGGLLFAFGAAMVPVLFAYGGWQTANFVAEEVREPRRNLPRARVPGHPGTTLLFVAACWLVVGATFARYPVNSLVGLGILLAGVPVYLAWRRTGTAD